MTTPREQSSRVRFIVSIRVVHAHTHVYFILLYLECESRLLVCCVFEVVTVHRDNLITSPQLTAQVRRSSRQDERYEDPFSILTSNNIETEAGRSLGENYRSRSPV